MTMIAIYKDENKNMRSMERNYPTKKSFEHDIKRNGFIFVAILTDKEIEAIKDIGHPEHDKVCDKYCGRKYWRNDIHEFVRQCL